MAVSGSDSQLLAKAHRSHSCEKFRSQSLTQARWNHRLCVQMAGLRDSSTLAGSLAIEIVTLERHLGLRGPQ